MGKAWRRSASHFGGGLPPGVVLTPDSGEIVLVTETGPFIDTHRLLVEVSPNGVDGWVFLQEFLIIADPDVIDAVGLVGQFLRGAPTLDGTPGVPVAQWSNVVEVPL